MADFIKKLKEFAEEFSEESDYYKQKQKESVVKDIAKIREEGTEKPAAQVAAVQQTTQPTDTRTTAQKAAAAQSAYDAYMGSEEQKANQGAANRKALQQMIDNIFAVPGVSASDLPLSMVSPIPTDTKGEQLKAEANYYQNQQKAIEDTKTMERKLAEYETWSAEDKAALDQYMIARENEQNNWFMAGSNPTYNPTASKLIQDKGLGEVRLMAEAIQRSRNEKIMEETTAAAQKVAEKTPALGSVASVGANLIGSFGIGETIKEVANRTGQFSTLDANNLGGMGSQFAGTVRQEVADDIRGENNNFLRNLAATVYEGGMSAADSAARLAAGGFSSGVSAVIAASGSFNNSLRQYSAQGASPEQAAAAALLNSGIEYLSEKIPMDELLKVGQSKTMMRDILKQTFLTEPLTEEVSLFMGAATEAAILGDKSSLSQEIGDMIANGMSYTEARKAAYKNLLKEAAKTYAVSAVAGLFGAGGAAAIGKATQNTATQQTKPATSQTEQQTTQNISNLKTNQQAMDEIVESTFPNIPKDTPVQKTEVQKQIQEGFDDAVGVTPKTETDNAPGIKGTGAAEANFSGKAAYQDLLTDDNVQPDRPGDVRPTEVPIKDSYGRNVSQFVKNAVGAEITPDKMVDTIEDLVQEGALGYDRRNNQDALNNAAAEIEKKGAGRVKRRITTNIANGKLQDGDIEQAMLLYANYANKNGQQAQDAAAELMVDLATMANMTGRNLQLFKLLRKLTPEGQVSAITKMVQQNVENMIRSGQVEKGYSPDVDSQLLADYRQAAQENARAVTEEQKQASAEKMQQIQQAIMATEAAKLPATFKAKWDAWRYMAMLGNAKTQIRNVVGNLAMMPYKDVKDTFAALFEKALPKDQRTKSVFTDKELLAWAKADTKTDAVQNALKYTGKLGDDATNAQFAENRKVFDNDILEKTRKIVEEIPQNADLFFKNDYYARSLADFLKARGYSAESVKTGEVSEAVMNEARGYAIQEAMKATFNDSNAFSDAVSSIGRRNTDNAWSKVFNYAAESILPFRRTPANIVVRFAEYSPVGLAKGAWDMATKVKNGDISAATAIDQMAAGLAGTGAMLLGYALAKGIAGIKLTGSDVDEDEKRQGHQEYAIEFSIDGQEYSYKIDWAAPANLPLFVGANIYNMMENAGAETDVSKFTAILRGMTTMFEPMLALSCLSGLNDLFETARYAQKGEALYAVASDIITGYFTQGIPALLRQGYQATQVNKQTTFANSEDPTIRDLQKTAANIPFVGAKFQTDKLNAWGEPETTESGFWRAINAFVNPGTFKNIDNGAVEREISRLNNAQSVNVSPKTVEKTASYTDKNGVDHKNMRLTEEQYQAMAKAQGQTAAQILSAMISRPDYQALTDAQKAAAIEDVYEYAAEQGKKAAFDDYYSEASAWIQNAKPEDISTFVNRGATSLIEKAVEATVNAISNDWEVTEAAKKNMEETYTAYSKMSEEAKQQVQELADGDAARYIEVRDKGVDTKAYLEAMEELAALLPEQGEKEVNDAQRWEAITASEIADDAADAIIKAYMKDYDPDNGKDTQTEIKYDYIRQEMGLTPEQFAKVNRVYYDVKNTPTEELKAAGTDKKTEYLKGWREIGLTPADATKLYNLLVATGKQKVDVVGWYESKQQE